MCLIKNPEVVINGNKVWKRLVVRRRTLQSINRHYIWKPGWNIAEMPTQLSDSLFVEFGFHTYLEIVPPLGMIVAEFTFDLGDLIATGYHNEIRTSKQAVFKRLHLAENEYARIMSNPEIVDFECVAVTSF